MSTTATMPAGEPGNRGPQVIATFWTLTGIITVMTALRFWARRMIRGIAIDDWLMLGATAWLIVEAATSTYLAVIGGFKHISALTNREIEDALKWNYIVQGIVILAFILPKLSIGFLILRTINRAKNRRFYIVVALMCIVVVLNIVNTITTYAQCSPPAALWKTTIHGDCWDPNVQKDIAYTNASFNILTDFTFALLPATIIYNLKLPTMQKVSLIILLGIGCLAGIFSCIKVHYLSQLTARSDVTWDTYDLLVWSEAEAFMLVFCGNIPPLAPFFDRSIRKRVGGRSSGQHAGKGGYTLSNTANNKYGRTGPVISTYAKDNDRDEGVDDYDRQIHVVNRVSIHLSDNGEPEEGDARDVRDSPTQGGLNRSRKSSDGKEEGAHGGCSAPAKDFI